MRVQETKLTAKKTKNDIYNCVPNLKMLFFVYVTQFLFDVVFMAVCESLNIKSMKKSHSK